MKRTLEGNFGRVRVRGEITELKRYPSGHIYFSLKDEGAKIAGVVWKSAVSRLGMVPENGVEVIATGRISAYAERSSYQLITERMEYAGAGALLARIEMLRLRLAAEGLFDADRKRALPVLPSVIGVVTSERGAVIQDIRTTIARRFPRHVLLWPVPVQGEGAAERIAAAIAGFERVAPAARRADRRARRRQPGRPDGVQRGSRDACRRRLPHPADLRGGARDGHHADRFRLRPARADADGGGGTGGAGAGRSGGRPGAQGGAADRRAEPAGAGAAGCACRARNAGCPTCPRCSGGARQRLDDRAERLVLALPNLLHKRRAALDAVGAAAARSAGDARPPAANGCRSAVCG